MAQIFECQIISPTPLCLENPGRENVISQINRLGFLVLDLPEDLLQLNREVLTEAQTFFGRPTLEKNNFQAKFAGGEGYFRTHFETAVTSSTPDPKEFWHSQGPEFSDLGWPQKLEGWQKKADALFSTSVDISRKLSRLLLSIAQIDCPENLFDSGWSTLRQIHYPQSQNSADFLAYEHTGIQFLGLQWPATTPGLQFFTPDERWVELQNRQCLTINIGEMLTAFSRGYFKPTLHRVCKQQKETSRQANVFFFHINPNTHLFVNNETIKAEHWLKKRIEEISL